MNKIETNRKKNDEKKNKFEKMSTDETVREGMREKTEFHQNH